MINKKSIDNKSARPRSCGNAGCEECYGRSSSECTALQRRLAKWALAQPIVTESSPTSYEETYDRRENCPYCLDATAKVLFIDLQQAREEIASLRKENK